MQLSDPRELFFGVVFSCSECMDGFSSSRASPVICWSKLCCSCCCCCSCCKTSLPCTHELANHEKADQREFSSIPSLDDTRTALQGRVQQRRGMCKISSITFFVGTNIASSLCSSWLEHKWGFSNIKSGIPRKSYILHEESIHKTTINDRDMVKHKKKKGTTNIGGCTVKIPSS